MNNTNQPKQNTSTAKRHIKSESIKVLEKLAVEKLKEKYPNFPFPPKPKYSDKTANGLTKAVIDYINFNGHQAERITNMGRQIGSKWIPGNGTNGTADISATIQGKSVKIEIKCLATGDKKQSPAQLEYQKRIEAAGGIYLIVRTFEQFYEWYNGMFNIKTVNHE